MFPKDSPAIGAGDLLRLLLCGLSFNIKDGLSLYPRKILSTLTFENHLAQLSIVSYIIDHLMFLICLSSIKFHSNRACFCCTWYDMGKYMILHIECLYSA